MSLEMTVKIQWQKEQISLLKQHIRRLEEAGDAMVETTTTPAAEAWRKAKDAKP